MRSRDVNASVIVCLDLYKNFATCFRVRPENTFNALGLQLIKLSLPPGKTLVFISNPDFWHSSLEHYGQLVELRISGLFASYHEAPLRRFERRDSLSGLKFCLDIQLFLSSVYGLLGLSKSTGKTSSRRRYRRSLDRSASHTSVFRSTLSIYEY